jgi:hypothetical protein
MNRLCSILAWVFFLIAAFCLVAHFYLRSTPAPTPGGEPQLGLWLLLRERGYFLGGASLAVGFLWTFLASHLRPKASHEIDRNA